MDINELRGAITAVTFATFVGICWWAYRAGNRDRFERDARIPFLDDEGAGPGETADEEEAGR